MFLWGISIVLLLVLAIISFFVVLPALHNPSTVTVQEVFSAPDVKINFDMLDSGQVQHLELFPDNSSDGPGVAGRANPFIK